MRQVREEAPDLSERVRLVLGDIVDGAASCMDLGAAQLFLGHVFAERPLDDRRAGNQHLGVFLRHHREMRRHQPGGRQAGDRTERRRCDRHRAHALGHGCKSARRVERLADRASAACAGDAAAAALMQADQRHAVLQRQILDIDALAKARRIRRTAAHGEVLAADHREPPVDTAHADYEIGGRDALERPVRIALDPARAAPMLAEAARIDQDVDAFADGQPPLRVLAGHRLRAALFQRRLALGVNILDLAGPAHRSILAFWGLYT